MTIQEIFDRFDAIGCCTFATLDGDYPETRIAHFLARDREGLYFMTMTTKHFYRQLKQTGKVSVCGLCANSTVEQTEDGNLKFDAGYFIRLTGDVREVSMEEIKAKNDPAFEYCIEDQARYPEMTAFVIHRARGEIFDYEFDKQHRDHKLERERFSCGGFPVDPAGLTITENCISCGNACAYAPLMPFIGTENAIALTADAATSAETAISTARYRRWNIRAIYEREEKRYVERNHSCRIDGNGSGPLRGILPGCAGTCLSG